MKQIGFTLMLFVIVLSPLAAVCQKLPDAPRDQAQAKQAGGQPQSEPDEGAPPSITPPDKEWRKIQRLPIGGEIVVASSHALPVHCRFAAATDDALFCDAPESPEGTGWQFDRASVVSVAATILKKSWHPGLVAAMIAGGTLMGLAATHNMSAGHAAQTGAIGAVITGAAGAPIALSQPDEQWEMVVYRPRVAIKPVPAAHAR